MIKFFISHKAEDAYVAKQLANELAKMFIPVYLDLLDDAISLSGKELTDHIKANLNNCTDILVIMSEKTYRSEWVPFEVGMSAQRDMPTATYLNGATVLPSFLAYWPRLRQVSDIKIYVDTRRQIDEKYKNNYSYTARSKNNEFYSVLKGRL